MAEPFLGEIRMVGFNFAPRGWALCNGQILAINTNTALFSLLGTTYGGNGTTTFALPNLQSRVPVHAGQGPGLSFYNLGQASGSENVTLLSNQMPTHTHVVNAASGAAPSRGGTSPSGNLLAVTSPAGPDAVNVYSGAAPGATMSPQMIATAGGGQPFGILQPYLTVNFIIALEGLFPSRN